jgi:hypothetical protein
MRGHPSSFVCRQNGRVRRVAHAKTTNTTNGVKALTERYESATEDTTAIGELGAPGIGVLRIAIPRRSSHERRHREQREDDRTYVHFHPSIWRIQKPYHNISPNSAFWTRLRNVGVFQGAAIAQAVIGCSCGEVI